MQEGNIVSLLLLLFIVYWVLSLKQFPLTKTQLTVVISSFVLLQK